MSSCTCATTQPDPTQARPRRHKANVGACSELRGEITRRFLPGASASATPNQSFDQAHRSPRAIAASWPTSVSSEAFRHETSAARFHGRDEGRARPRSRQNGFLSSPTTERCSSSPPSSTSLRLERERRSSSATTMGFTDVLKPASTAKIAGAERSRLASLIFGRRFLISASTIATTDVTPTWNRFSYRNNAVQFMVGFGFLNR